MHPPKVVLRRKSNSLYLMNNFNFYILRRKSNSLCLMNDFNFYHGVLNHFYKL